LIILAEKNKARKLKNGEDFSEMQSFERNISEKTQDRNA